MQFSNKKIKRRRKSEQKEPAEAGATESERRETSVTPSRVGWYLSVGCSIALSPAPTWMDAMGAGTGGLRGIKNTEKGGKKEKKKKETALCVFV